MVRHLDRVVGRIAGSLTGTTTGVIARSELKRARRDPTSSLDVFDHYLIGVQLKHTFKEEDFLKALD